MRFQHFQNITKKNNPFQVIFYHSLFLKCPSGIAHYNRLKTISCKVSYQGNRMTISRQKRKDKIFSSRLAVLFMTTIFIQTYREE